MSADKVDRRYPLGAESASPAVPPVWPYLFPLIKWAQKAGKILLFRRQLLKCPHSWHSLGLGICNTHSCPPGGLQSHPGSGKARSDELVVHLCPFHDTSRTQTQ